MAAAGAAAKQGMWIARMWRKGWETIPVIMASHCLTAPFVVYFIGERLIVGRPEVPVERYRYKYTVVRPGDPRIARINNHSYIDTTGIFSWT